MNINLEQIDVLRQRANVSYEEAKEALENCNGDMVEALVYLEKGNKVRRGYCHNHEENGFVNSIKRLVRKGQETRFVMRKGDLVALNVPVNAVVATTVIAAPITIGGVLIGLFSNYKIKFVKKDGQDLEVNKVFDKVSSAVANVNSSAEVVQK